MTKHYIYNYIFLLFSVIIASCSKGQYSGKLEKIKAVGDKNPTTAIAMLDSLETQTGQISEYEKNKTDLLRIRLNDKAVLMPTSDTKIKEVVEYFQDKGSTLEKQEAYYYAGSTYRDLKDTPRALGYFLKVLDLAKKDKECDSVMLKNTYSNLTYLYYQVQNYKDALDAAETELQICKATNNDLILPYMHIGSAYLAVDSFAQANKTFDIVYNLIINSDDVANHKGTLVYLLNHYSQLANKEKAEKCFIATIKDKTENSSNFANLAFAQYYVLNEKGDSAIYFCKKIIESNSNLFDMHDAAKMLYRIYSDKSDMNQALLYAKKYIRLSDSLDLGKRQELAATVNNEYRYHQDQIKEQELQEQNSKYKKGVFLSFILTIFIVCIGYMLYYKNRSKHLQEILTLSTELERLSYDEQQLREEIAYKEQMLKQKTEQNKEFMKLLHQSELEEKAEDVLESIRQSSIGRKNMNTDDWKQLYQAVDELYPTFRDRMLKELETFNEQQMQVCYLMRIGLSKPQIQNITNLSRVTIWRWVKKYDWVMTPD